MTGPQSNSDEPVRHLPPGLVEHIVAEVPADRVRATAPFDLDEKGMYVDGHLVLADGRVGCFVRRDGAWQGQWLGADDIERTELVEGVGVNLLRMLTDGKVTAEVRFTLRHARSVARLRRRLDRRLAGAAPDEADATDRPGPGEKKIRCEKCDRVIPSWSEFCPSCTSRRKILFRIIDFVKPYKARAAAGALLALVTTSMELVLPYLRKPLVDEGLGAARGNTPDKGLFLMYVSLMGGLFVVMLAGRAVQGRLMAVLGSNVSRDLRFAIYRHLHKLSLSFFSRRQVGSLVTRITSDSERLWDFVTFTFIEVAVALLTIVGVGVSLFLLQWKLAVFVLMPIPVMMVLMVVFHKKLHRFFRRLFHRWSQLTSLVAGALPGVRVIKAFSQEDHEIDRFRDRNDQVYDEAMNLIRVFTTFGPVMQFCTQVGILVVWLVGGWWVIRGFTAPDGDATEQVMTIGTLLAFIGYLRMFYRPVHRIAHMDQMFNRAATSAQRIFDVLDTAPAIFSRSEAKGGADIAGEIELQNVSFSYDGIRRVLKDVSLRIAPGEMVGLAGPSGAGKTTMVNLICRFYDAMEGRILVDGVDVRDYDLETLRTSIGVVLQDPFLFHGSVARNIAYGRPDAPVDQVIEAARAANAHDFIVAFPDGYDTVVGERGQTLSGGERQRISIARAILNNPSVLILDEATSSVDTQTEKLIQEALDRLVAHRTTIAIAHRLSTLRKADRLIILDKGEIAEQGTHRDLAEKEGGLYASLLKMQSESSSVIALSGPPPARRGGLADGRDRMRRGRRGL